MTLAEENKLKLAGRREEDVQILQNKRELTSNKTTLKTA
jgi:hypothetical protein